MKFKEPKEYSVVAMGMKLGVSHLRDCVGRFVGRFDERFDGRVYEI
jgi:hypothetical protein